MGSGAFFTSRRPPLSERLEQAIQTILYSEGMVSVTKANKFVPLKYVFWRSEVRASQGWCVFEVH